MRKHLTNLNMKRRSILVLTTILLSSEHLREVYKRSHSVKEQNMQKGRKPEKTYKAAVDLRSDATLIKLGLEKIDTKMLVLAEAHHHHSYYRSYTR